MINRFNGANTAQTMAAKPVTWTAVTKTARGVVSSAQHILTVVGLSALALAAAVYARPDLAQQVTQVLHPAPEVVAVQDEAVQAPPLMPVAIPQSGVAVLKAAPLSAANKALAGNSKQQQAVTTWLSKRYRVAGDAANMLVSTAYVTAREVKIDPLLILAVMAIESGLNPFAESPVGAQGLMQVMSKIHHAKFAPLGGVKAAFNPVANIKVGSQILKEYMNRGGSVEAGLKTYVGAAAFDNDAGYGSRVMAELNKLKQVAAGKNVPFFRAPPAPAAVITNKAQAPEVLPAPAAPAQVEGEQMASLQ